MSQNLYHKLQSKRAKHDGFYSRYKGQIPRLRNYEMSGKSLDFIDLLPTAQSSLQNENLVNTTTKLFENGNWTFPIVRHFK